MDFRLIRHLHYFHTVAEERHFGRAAERLGISQPPLSTQIKVLERVLGVNLFERSRSGVRLTSHGEAILPAVKRMVDHAERLESIVHLTKSGQVHSLVIGAVTSAMFRPLGEGLRKVKQHFPELSVSMTEMDTADALQALRRKEIDLAFVRTDTVDAPLICKPMERERLAVAMPPDHPLRIKDTVCIEDLTDIPLVTCAREISPAYFDEIQAQFRHADMPFVAPHTAKSIASQIAMVACGVGLALVPRSFVDFESDAVAYRPLNGSVEVTTTAAVWNMERPTEVVEKFISLVEPV